MGNYFNISIYSEQNDIYSGHCQVTLLVCFTLDIDFTYFSYNWLEQYEIFTWMGVYTLILKYVYFFIGSLLKHDVWLLSICIVRLVQVVWIRLLVLTYMYEISWVIYVVVIVNLWYVVILICQRLIGIHLIHLIIVFTICCLARFLIYRSSPNGTWTN